MNTFRNIEEVKAINGKIPPNSTICADCLELMPQMESGIFDMILCDLPYGTTACKWDAIIPFDKLWEQYERLIKPNGAIVLFGAEPFSSLLRMSNLKMYKYDWIWEKSRPSGISLSKNQPMRKHEMIIVFAPGKTTFNKQLEEKEASGIVSKRKAWKTWNTSSEHGLNKTEPKFCNEKRNPTTILKFSSVSNFPKSLHPTQKPVPLFEYLIKTYTNEGELILDNCAGSGTTGEACYNTGRNYIQIEREQKYFDLILGREKTKNELQITIN